MKIIVQALTFLLLRYCFITNGRDTHLFGDLDENNCVKFTHREPFIKGYQCSVIIFDPNPCLLNNLQAVHHNQIIILEPKFYSFDFNRIF